MRKGFLRIDVMWVGDKTVAVVTKETVISNMDEDPLPLLRINDAVGKLLIERNSALTIERADAFHRGKP